MMNKNRWKSTCIVAAACCLAGLLFFAFNHGERVDLPNTSRSKDVASNPSNTRNQAVASIDEPGSVADSYAYARQVLSKEEDPYERSKSFRGVELSEEDRKLFLSAVEEAKISLLGLELKNAKIDRQEENKYTITISSISEDDRLALVTEMLVRFDELNAITTDRVSPRKLVDFAEQLIRVDLGPVEFGRLGRSIELELQPEPEGSPYSDKYKFWVKSGEISNRGVFLLPDTSGYTFLSPYVSIIFKDSDA